MFKLSIDKNQLKKLTDELIQKFENSLREKIIEFCDRALELQWVQFQPVGYNDETGQLRSSTGYILYRDGQVIHEKFELADYGTDRAPGLKAGRDTAYGTLRESPGWGILFVSGMEYAEFVEANGFSVLSHVKLEVMADFYKEINSIIIR